MKTRWCCVALIGLSGAAVLCGQQTAYFIRTAAGTYASGDGGLAANAVLGSLGKVIADSAGNVYFAETFAGKVHMVSPNGVMTAVAGGGGSTPALQATITPYALALDGSGNLYIADLYGDCDIWRINLPTGAAIAIAGNGQCAEGADGAAANTSFYAPSGLAYDNVNGLLITERFGYRVRRLDLGRLTVTTIIGTGKLGNSADGLPPLQTAIGSTEDVAIDNKGEIFVVDETNCVIRKLDPNANLMHIIAGQSAACGYSGENVPPTSATLGAPYGLVSDPAGVVLFVVEGNGVGNNSRIQKIDLGANVITTYAGMGTWGDSGDGGPATKAPLAWPLGVAMYSSGGLLVSEYLGERVRRIDSADVIHPFAGTANRAAGDGGPALAASLSPGATAPNFQAGCVIADSGNHRVREVSSMDVISLVAGTDVYHGSSGDGGAATSAGLNLVYGIAVDPSGPIYISEGTGEIRVINQGQISRLTPATFDFPQGIALDPSHTFLYVAEYAGDRVVRLNIATGAVNTIAGLGQPGAPGSPGDDGDSLPANQSRLNMPTDVAVDPLGNVYVMDSGNAVIRRINPLNNTMATVAGNHKAGLTGDGALATSASLTLTSGLTVDAAGDIFFAEKAKIREVPVNTQMLTTIAGNAPGFSGDGGPALSAQLQSPSGLSIDPQGNLYFVDNSRVRVLTPQSAAPMIAAPIVAADFGGGYTITPGTWIEIYGQNLAPVTQEWAAANFNGNQAPNSLDNVQVMVGGQQAYIELISPTQVNAEVPDGVAAGNAIVQVINTQSKMASNYVAMSVASSARAPALLAPPSFTAGGKFYVAAQFSDLTFAGPPNLVSGGAFRRAKAGDTVVIYGVGFGQGSPPVPAGMIDAQLTSLPNMSVTIGGVNATLTYAGLTATYVGLYQFDIVIPSGVSGDSLLQMSVNGVPIQQTLFLALQ